MAGARSARIELGAAAWLVVAAVLALACGLLVAVAPELALDLAAIGLAAVVVRRHPLGSLMVILAARAVLPNSVLIGFLTLGAGALALIMAAPGIRGKRVVTPFLALLLIALAST